MTNNDDSIIVALDIGTSKIVAIVAEIREDNMIYILGLGSHISTGLKRGVVVNIEQTIQSIKRAIDEAELMSGINIKTVYAGIAGSHIEGHNTDGVTVIKDKKEVSQEDVDRVMTVAKSYSVSGEKIFLHALQQDFTIDGQKGIKYPIGMSGTRLEVDAHLVYGSVSAANNIKKCIQRCNLGVADLVLEQLASSYAVLSEDEKDIGVCLLDIGGGTADIAVFIDGALRHTAVIPIAGDQVTKDIAIALRTSTSNAEEIKIRYGCALAKIVGADETIKVKAIAGVGTRTIQRDVLSSTAECRYTEIFDFTRLELAKSGFSQRIAAGLVLCGGASKIEGASQLAEEVLNMPVRIGIPTNVGGIKDVVQNPAFATGVGLLIYASKEGYAQQKTQPKNINVFNKMVSWFQDNF
ncbi:MAG: cell division protein FtsA [Gammaproteobacteria bacterium]|nr:MAG: cell division protein FtsA [Gammaproteobacteria bacterium]